MKELIIATVFILLAGVACSQKKKDNEKEAIKTETVKQDSTSYFLVSGKLIDSTGKPKSGKELLLLFGEKASVYYSDAGIFQNPSVETDENGNFHLKVNKLLLCDFEYKFMFEYRRKGRPYVVDDDMNQPIVFEIDSTVEKLDLGELKIK